jgi:hypothetical protein
MYKATAGAAPFDRWVGGKILTEGSELERHRDGKCTFKGDVVTSSTWSEKPGHTVMATL